MTPPPVTDLVDRLRERAAKEHRIAENSRVVAELLQPQFAKFEAREVPWNTYAVRMAVEHEQSAKRDAEFAELLTVAAATIERLSQAERGMRERCADAIEDAIASGYPTPANKVDQCCHSKFGWEDCIACYDEFLSERVAAIRALPITGETE